MSKANSASSIRSARLIGSIIGLLVFAIGFSGVLLFSRAGNADDAVILSGNHPAEADTFRQLGEMSSDLPLQMQVRFALRHKKALQNLLEEQQNPKSPNYRKWLTSDEFMERFGPTAAQIKAVSDWLG